MRGAMLVAIWLPLVVACGGPGLPPPTATPISPETVVVATPGVPAPFVRQGDRLFFANATDAAGIVPGSVIASGAGDGLLRRALTVRAVDGGVEVDTASAALADALASGRLATSVHVGRSSDGDPRAVASAGARPADLEPIALTLNGVVLDTTTSDGNPGGQLAIGHGGLVLSPSVILEVTNRARRSEQVVWAVSGGVDLSLALRIEAAAAEPSSQRALLRPEPDVPLFRATAVGWIDRLPVPISVSIDVELGVDIDADGPLEVDLDVALNTEIDLGAGFANGVWTPRDTLEVDGEWTSPEVSPAATTGVGRVWLRPLVTVRVFDTEAFSLDLRQGPTVVLGEPPDPRWELGARWMGTVGIEPAALDERLPRFAQPVLDRVWVLAEDGVFEPVNVQIEPATATLPPGGQRSFLAWVSGTTDGRVAWYATAGTILGSGEAVTYVAPDDPGRYLLTAVSLANPQRYASAVIIVGDVGAVTVIVTPALATLEPGGSRSFTASVSGAEDASVTWSATAGTIAGDGNEIVYTAPGEAGTFRVLATSLADTTATGIAVVVVPGAPEPRSSTTLAAGWNHSLAVTGEGEAWSWGQNRYGQVGDAAAENRLLPERVNGVAHVTAVAGGGYHSLALDEDGTVWAWGDNGFGQLGDGSFARRSTPAPVPGLDRVVAIAAGDQHSLALRNDGSVWTWGFNGFGQLGDGLLEFRNVPAPVPGLGGVVAIAAGDQHSLALRDDGTVRTWGLNARGQIGDGSRTDRRSPVPVAGLTAIVAIAGGFDHSVAIDSTGSAWAWGANGYGQIGDGTSTDRLTPRQVAGITDAHAVAAGFDHTLVLSRSGAMYAWGYNGFGQLGDGTTTLRRTPVVVATMADVVGVAAGSDHSLALLADGTVWSWGFNAFGQVGDGTTEARARPVRSEIGPVRPPLAPPP